MKKLKCIYCGERIRRSEAVEWPYIHIDGIIRCDGILKRKVGFKEAKKAQPFIFDNYLKQAEKLEKI